MKVHTAMGSGFQEVIYQRCLALGMGKQGIGFDREMEMCIFYDSTQVGTRRVDLLVENKVMVELKAITQLGEVQYAQCLNYPEAYKLEIGLLINFGRKRLTFERFHNSKLHPGL